MEGDGPTGCLVIPEFYALKVHLEARVEELSLGDALLPFVRSMQARVDRYFNEALQCNTTVMATILNPFFRLQFFERAFGQEHEITTRARKLLQDQFDLRQTNPNVTQPQPDPTAQSGQLNQAGPANLFQLFKAEEPKVEANEIASYLKGTHPMSVKDNARQTKAVLPWWRVCPLFHSSLYILQKDVLIILL
ncbi:hypothetical protein DFH28DRAFT_918799 [Melampsora americana]|nr:hypothetical protein DFH28DRAFT_918799 [Melampsora americana]